MYVIIYILDIYRLECPPCGSRGKSNKFNKVLAFIASIKI